MLLRVQTLKVYNLKDQIIHSCLVIASTSIAEHTHIVYTTVIAVSLFSEAQLILLRPQSNLYLHSCHIFPVASKHVNYQQTISPTTSIIATKAHGCVNTLLHSLAISCALSFLSSS